MASWQAPGVAVAVVKGATGARIEFERDAQGRATAALLKEPNSVFHVTRLAEDR